MNMALGECLREAREAAEMTQLEFAFEVNMSRSAIGMVEINERKLPPDVRRKAVEVLDDGWFTLAVIEEAAGHAFIPKLNGPKVDLHRSSVKNKTIEELPEALEAIQSVCVANHPDYIEQADRERLYEALIQCGDAVVALVHYIIVICKDYRFSWIQFWKDVRKKLKKKGFVKAA
jgi:transcriptional regulator with XRE-family HTH domain